MKVTLNIPLRTVIVRGESVWKETMRNVITCADFFMRINAFVCT